MLIHTNVVRKVKRDLSGDEANEDTAHKRKKHEYASNAFEAGKPAWALFFVVAIAAYALGLLSDSSAWVMQVR